MTPEVQRAMLAAELELIRSLNPHLTVDGLSEVRTRLRHSDTVELAATRPALGELRGLVLDVVCRRLVDEHGWPAVYLAGIGDLLATAPGDLSELDGG